MGIAVQEIMAPAGGQTHEQHLAGHPPLVLRGAVTGYGGHDVSVGSSLAEGDWSGCVNVLARQLDAVGAYSLGTWDGDFILCAFLPKANQLVLYKSLTCSSSVYYRLGDETFAFSTNPLDLLSTNDNRCASVEAELLPVLLTGRRYAPTRSCFRHVLRLPAGHLLTLDAERCLADRIANFEPEDLGRLSLCEAADAARSHVLGSARRRLRPGQKIGVLVSGGVDSAVAAYAAQEAGAEVTAIHCSFAGYAPADEHRYADAVIRHLHLPHVTLPMAADRDEGSRYLDPDWKLPVPHSASFFAWYAIAAKRAANRGIDALTTGALGDHIFGATNVPDARSLLAGVPPRTAWVYAREFLGTYVPFDRVLHASVGSSSKRAEWLTEQEVLDDTERMLRPWARAAAADNGRYRFPSDLPNGIGSAVHQAIKTSLDTELDTALDLAAMNPRGIHYMRLFADRALINFGLGLPPAYRWFPAGGQFYQKAALRLAFATLLPPVVIRRNFRTQLQGMEEIYCRNNRAFLGGLLDEKSWLVRLDVIDPHSVRRIIADLANFPDASAPLIRAAMTEIWLRSLSGERTEEHAVD